MVERSWVKSLRTAMKRPDLIRNRALGALNYWPVSPLRKNLAYCEIPHYCISLKTSIGRRKMVQRQVDRMGIKKFEFVDGILGVKLDMDELIRDGIYDRDEAMRCHGRELSPGEIGVSLTHSKIYDDIVEQGLESAVILEDDVLFQTRHLDALDLATIPDDYDVVLLNAGLDEEPPQGHVTGTIYDDRSYEAFCVAYLVSAKGAKKLAAAAKPVRHAPDGLIGRGMPNRGDEPHPFRRQGVPDDFELNVYITYPFCALNGSASQFVGSSFPTSVPFRPQGSQPRG